MKLNKISRKLRKKINNSGKGLCSLCNKSAPLEEHHIAGRKIKNYNHPSNICHICPTCHAKIHLKYLILEGWVKTTNGTELFWHKNGEKSFTGQSVIPYIIPIS